MIDAIPHLKNNPTMAKQYLLRQNVVYSTETGVELELSIFLPWALEAENITQEKLPLIVFVQGSAWTTPNLNFELPHLGSVAREGFVLATVGHRDTSLGHPFPAFLQDVKCAIRYLRANAEQYAIDPERVVIWGTSSGGNIALLVGLTCDEERYKTGEYAEYSDSVNAVAACFPPTDIISLTAAYIETPHGQELKRAWAGSTESEIWLPKAREMSPVNHVEPGKTYPPILMLNGTADPIVPHTQMESLYEKLKAVGSDVSAYYVDGAEHEGSFWTEEVREIILDYLKKHSGI